MCANRHISDYITQRNKELLDAFHDAFSIVEYPTTIDAVALAASKYPCSRFWISTSAFKRLHAKVVKSGYIITHTQRRRMYDELVRRCNGNFSNENVTQVINNGAPEFYLTPQSILVILCRYLKSL